MTKRGARFPHVDALRAIAALAILGYHVAFVTGELHGWLAPLNFGVPLFFAISGFLLYRPFAAARAAGEPMPGLRSYAVRRALRILPAYWVALTAIAILTARHDVFTASGIVTYYGFLQAYRPSTVTGGIGQAWTLTVEVAFYALLPLIALGMRRVRGGVRSEWLMLGGLVALSTLWKVVVMLAVEPTSSAYFPLLIALPAELDLFALGMGLAVFSIPIQARLVKFPAWAPWVVALVAYAALAQGWFGTSEFAQVIVVHLLQGVIALGLLTPAVVGTARGGRLRTFLKWKPIAWVGLVSYGLYLWHLDILKGLHDAGAARSGIVLVGIAGSIAAGAASWYHVERHAIRWAHRQRAAENGRRDLALTAAGLVLLAPTALAFFGGGYFDTGRVIAAIVAWVVAAAAAVASPRPLPASWAGRASLAGLAGLLGWTILSVGWAPLHGPAIDDAQRLALYLGFTVAAVAVVRGPVVRLVEPVLAAGALIVIGYGIAERLVPGLLHYNGSAIAAGRLEQPLGYWNAMGALAAIGVVLATRLAGDPSRDRILRAAGAAAVAPLAAGVALTFSRGAIAAVVIGVAVLVTLSPTRAQLRAAGLALAAGIPAALAIELLPAVKTLDGALGRREAQGLAYLAVLALLAAGAAWLTTRGIRRPTPAASIRVTPTAARRNPARSPAADDATAWHVPRRLVGVILTIALLLAAGAAATEGEPGTGDTKVGATASRLTSTDSNRYAYWKVTLESFADAPLKGHGSGSFATDWLRERTKPEVVRDAHSLELETAGELGAVGLVFLLLFLGGIAAAALRVARRDPALSAGPIAALVVYVAHGALDWDWEMPALTLVALVLGAMLLTEAEHPPAPEPAAS